MNIEDKERLALYRDDSKKAGAIRLVAARLTAGLSQEALGKRAGIQKAAVSNIENGHSYPSRKLMVALFREFQIDFNFMMYGEFRHLSQATQDQLFPNLEHAKNEWDRKASSH